MIRARRFRFDGERVVEVAQEYVEPIAPSAGEAHDRTRQEYNGDRQGKASALRQATLERAERREFAHKTYGTESRWRD